MQDKNESTFGVSNKKLSLKLIKFNSTMSIYSSPHILIVSINRYLSSREGFKPNNEDSTVKSTVCTL